MHAAPSKGRRFIEAVGFAKGLLGADVSDILSSARVKGVSISSDPSPPRKKYPFTVDQLVQLERLHFMDMVKKQSLQVTFASQFMQGCGGQMHNTACKNL